MTEFRTRLPMTRYKEREDWQISDFVMTETLTETVLFILRKRIFSLLRLKNANLETILLKTSRRTVQGRLEVPCTVLRTGRVN